MEKEFFDKYINVSEAEMLKGAIYGQCRIMDKEDVYNWIYEDELKLKKQKEVINKAIEFYENNKQECVVGRNEEGKLIKKYYLPAHLSKPLIDILNEVSE